MSAPSETADNTSTEPSADSKNTTEPTTDTEKKTLIVYFSESGNTEIMANYIHDEIGGDIVKIIPTVKYPETYNELADYAKAEQDNDERPAFNDLGVSIDDYDVIFVGYPIWWYTILMIMHTFFETYDFSGKMLIPFNTHEGSRASGTYELIRELEPDANVLEGLPIRGGDVAKDDSKQAVKDWLAGLEY